MTLNLNECFNLLGVKQDDIVMIHGDAGVAAQLVEYPLGERLNRFLESIIAYFRHGGTVIVPAFSYSFTRCEDYDLRYTPSEVGLFSEAFRKLPGIKRTRHPIFSVSVFGKYADNILNCTNTDCFGLNTVFEFLKNNDAKVICMGCELENGITFIHHVEQMFGVPYRYFKTFEGYINDGTNSIFAKTSYYVRDTSLKTEIDLTKFKEVAVSNIGTSLVGRYPVTVINAADIYRIAFEMLEQDNFSLIKEGNLRYKNEI